MTMKRTALAVLTAALAVAAAWAAAKSVTVVVESAKVRKGKAFYASAVATVRHKDRLDAGEPEDGWFPVTVDGTRGWLHESAVGATARKARGGGWSGSGEAGEDEVTLAGKGFNADVEKAHRSGDAGDYAAVDAMEARRVPEKELLAFMKAGKTLPRGDQ